MEPSSGLRAAETHRGSKMATSTDLNWEENLISHWMSNAARAGVILNPTVPGLKTTRAISTESVSSDHGINLVYRSSSISPSENTMHREQILDPKSSFEEKVNSSKILFSTSASNKEQTSMVKDVPAQLTSTETKPGSDQLDDLDEGCCTELLLQKLEQLKELQHHKKELLRRQQMEQIQRLMEEQQNLLSLVAEQQEHTGSPATKDEGTQNYAGSVCLSPIPYFPLCRSRGNTDWDSTSHVSSPVDQRDFLQNFNNNQILKKNHSADPCYKNQSLDISLKGNNELKVEDQNIISGRTKQSPEQSLQGSIEGDSDCEDQRNVEVSKNPTAGKCSEAVNAEERPIATCLQERKQTFEEFLEEQIRLEEQRLNEKANLKVVEKAAFQKPVSKQPFLKRGEGLNRYTNAKYKVAKQKESKTILQPDPLEIKNTLKTDKLQLHRKTASSNKISDNFVPKPVHQNIKTKKNLAFSARKTTGLRNCTGKGISSSTRQNSNEMKPEVLRNSLRSEINGEKEKNKENVMPLAKLHEIDVKLPAGKEALSEVSEFLINPCEKDQELSFELSFQKKLGNWEAEKEKEKNELDEFLFLEQAADEVSFASNSSLIIRILDQGQQISSGHRLSSTPIKSRLQEKQINVLNVTTAANINGRNGVSQGSNHERHQDSSQVPEPFMVHRSSADYEALQTSSSAEFQDTKTTELDEDKSDESSEMTSESEEEFEITIKPANEGADKITLKKQSGCPEFSECKEPMESTESAKSPDSMEKDGGQSNELYREPAYPSVFCNDRNKFQFDDEISWCDFENSNLCSNMVSKVHLMPDCSKTPFPDKVIKRKIAMVKKGDALLKQNMAVNEETEPPTSDLMLKLFPSLKPKQKVDAQSRYESKSNMTQEESSGESVRSQLLKEKLVELEMEIERFRTENASLSKLREEHETALEKLRKEKSDYEHHKTQQLAQIEELKKEEARKLQKERKVFEKYAQAARAIPDKKERDEIQALKQQIATLQEDVKKRETKWSATHTRLRDQIEALTKENTQLREEIKIMERFRLEAWKRKEAPTKKKKNSISGYSDKNESTHLPALPKSHSGSSMNQIEKSSKINVKSDLPSEESLSPKCEPAKAYEADLDKKIKPEDSSQTFMANFPADGTVESSSAITFDSSESEEEVEREASHPDGKVEKVLKNGCHLIIFPNGTRKEVSYDGKTTTVTFFNGDVKQVLEDQRVIYYYADAKTIHTTYPTGLEVLHFSNGQIEKHFPDGKKEITFPDQTIKNVFTDGREVNIFPDGTIVHMQQDGSKIIEFSNGQQEVHTADFKRREYPDGTIKTVYADGHQETQYASGRLRVKNKNGDVVMDTHP